MREIAFTLNSRTVSVDATPETPLLTALRGPLGPSSARFGCGDGLCGACTVVLDGRAVMSCDTPLGAVEGRRVETAESLLDGDRQHPLVAALLETQAGQCGYCLPGILMTARALLEDNPVRDRAEIARALDSNLCRCGAHTRILDALETAAAQMAGERQA